MKDKQILTKLHINKQNYSCDHCLEIKIYDDINAYHRELLIQEVNEGFCEQVMLEF